MKIILLFVFFIYTSAAAQLPNQNMYLLRNLNTHFTSTLYSAIWGYAAPDGREYAILGCPTGTAFIDVTDSANIHEVDFLTGLTSSWREMKTYSHYAYIVSEATNSKLQIIDLQYLPDSVHLVQTWGYSGYTKTHSISQSGNYLYLNGGNASTSGGIQVLDISDPENPVKLGSWTTLYVHDCRVDNDTIYAANINNGKVSIINATNKSALSTVVTFNNLVGGGPHNTALSKDKKRLFVTDEIGTAPYLLKVWNIEDRSNPVYVTSWQPTGITTSIVHNIETYGNYGIIAHYTAGVRVINISNPDAPVEVAWYDTYPSNNNESYNGCWGVYMLPSGKIIASDRQTGLYVLKTDIFDISNPILINPVFKSINNPLPINFKWSKYNSSLFYILDVSTNSTFDSVFISDTVFIDTSKVVSGFQKDTKYFWRIRVKDTSGAINSSLISNFTTAPPIQTDIQLLFEGMYSHIYNQLIRKDTVEIFLRNSAVPFNIIDSANSIIDSISFNGSFKFLNANTGTYYYIVKHFNTIETWSKAGGEYMVNDGTKYSFDFTNNISQAYGNNLKLKGGKYCLYSGDVNKDGLIDLFDDIPIYNDATLFTIGRYLSTDLTGDGLIDLADVSLCYNNSTSFVQLIRP